jgi:hypothetical protein
MSCCAEDLATRSIHRALMQEWLVAAGGENQP